MINVRNREEIKKSVINLRFTCSFIKGCLTDKKKEKKPIMEAQKLFVGQADRKEAPEMEGRLHCYILDSWTFSVISLFQRWQNGFL